jgi:RHS repeat-associated protein
MFCDVDNDGIVTESEIIQEDHYYPFGMRHEGYGRTITQGENFYQYNGKELNEDFGLDMYDYGARFYDASVGRWFAVDPLAEIYFPISDYAYAANTPINAIDPNGKLIIFINGNHFGSGGTQEYWRSYKEEPIYRLIYDERMNKVVKVQMGTRMVETAAFDKSAMTQLNDNNAMYRDGALGGWAPFSGVANSSIRRDAMGRAQGYRDAKDIVARLTRDKDGKITETIKIITHSMGGAYGKGYVEGLIKWLKENSYYSDVIISLVADFDPYQAEKLTANKNIYTQQFDHRNTEGAADGDFPWLGGNEKQEGADYHRHDKTKSSHSISSFFGDISELKKGEYKWNKTNETWECTTCED